MKLEEEKTNIRCLSLVFESTNMTRARVFLLCKNDKVCVMRSQKRNGRVVYLCPSTEDAHTVFQSLVASQMYSSDYKTEETEKEMVVNAEALRARA